MIGLAGSVASGKTVYLCSLMMNGFDVMQRQNLTVRNAYGNPNDDYKIEMERNADRLMRYGICPESTSKAFKKPRQCRYRKNRICPAYGWIYLPGRSSADASGTFSY